MDLQGRIALVTGAQQGIGRATALALGRAGAAVAVNWLNDEVAAASIVEELRSLGVAAAAIRADLASVAEARRLVADTVRALGGLDILVNNAGVFPRVPFLEMSEAEWDRVLAVNLKGTAFCAQAAAAHMASAGRGGAIVNLSSSAIRGVPLGAHYAATKSGVIGLTRSLALALSPHRIRVNAIAPGLTDTAQPRDGHSEAELAEMGRSIPLGRMGHPDEIAALAVFLASEAAGWITGQVYHANGGSYLA